MRKMKKSLALILSLVMALTLCSCGCGNDETELEEPSEDVIESQVSGLEVLNEFWNLDLDASAKTLNGYHAMSVEEVTNNWKQAFCQKNEAGIVNGNGAILYAICAPGKREKCLNDIKTKTGAGSWNFYTAEGAVEPDQSLVPESMTIGTPERVVEDGQIRYYVEINEILKDGTTLAYGLFIDFIDGGYYLGGTFDFGEKLKQFNKETV